MENIKGIIEKARAVVAAHEAYNTVMTGPNKTDRDGDLWDALCAADRDLLFHPDARGVLETGDQGITLARLLVAAATLPMDAPAPKSKAGMANEHHAADCSCLVCHMDRVGESMEAGYKRAADEKLWSKYYAALIGKGLAVDLAVSRANEALAEHRKRWPHQD